MKLGIAAVLGMIIGLERELRKKPLGLKTSLVISVSSCLLTIVSIEAAARYAVAGLHVMDPMRLAAQIVSGIGFLGAGVILRKTNDVILGLTTAAMIWAASGLGIAVGAGFYLEAVAVMLLIIISVELIPRFVKRIGPSALRRWEMQLRLTVNRTYDLTEIIVQIASLGIKIRHMNIKDLPDGNLKVILVGAVPEKSKMTEMYYAIRKIAGIVSVEAESLHN